MTIIFVIFGLFVALAIFRNLIVLFWGLSNALLPFLTLVFLVYLYQLISK